MITPTKEIVAGGVRLGGNNPICLIAGPCVIENENILFSVAESLQAICRDHGVPFIFKASFDKANRSSLSSFRGPGMEKGLAMIASVKKRFGIPVLSDVHCAAQVGPAAEILDIIQIPAFLCRQTDLLVAAAKSGRPVNVKKGQFLAPWDVKNIIEKLEKSGAAGVLLTERGVSFGYNTLVSDFRSLPIMRSFGWPVVYDATHSVQQPGGQGARSGGDRSFVPALSRAAAAVGCDALFLEVHPQPDKALSDGPNMISPAELPGLLDAVREIDRLVRTKHGPGCTHH